MGTSVGAGGLRIVATLSALPLGALLFRAYASIRALPNRLLSQLVLDFSRGGMSSNWLDLRPLRQPEKEYAMNKHPHVSLALLAALLLAGFALAQTSTNPSGVNTDRDDRRCTTATLSTDPTAPCPDDVLNDRPGVMPPVVRPPANSAAASGNMSGGASTPPGNAGTTSTGTTGNPGGNPSAAGTPMRR
jgi:hypothetical protein